MSSYFFSDQPDMEGTQEGALTNRERQNLSSKIDKLRAAASASRDRGQRKSLLKQADRLSQQLNANLNAEAFEAAKRLHDKEAETLRRIVSEDEEAAKRLEDDRNDMVSRLWTPRPIYRSATDRWVWTPPQVSDNLRIWEDKERELARRRQASKTIGTVEINLRSSDEPSPYNLAQKVAAYELRLYDNVEARLSLADALGWKPIVDFDDDGAFCQWKNGRWLMLFNSDNQYLKLSDHELADGELSPVSLAATLAPWDKDPGELARLLGWWQQQWGLGIQAIGDRYAHSLAYNPNYPGPMGASSHDPKLLVHLAISSHLAARIELVGSLVGFHAQFHLPTLAGSIGVAIKMLRQTVSDHPLLLEERELLEAGFESPHRYLALNGHDERQPACFCKHGARFGTDCHDCMVRLAQLFE